MKYLPFPLTDDDWAGIFFGCLFVATMVLTTLYTASH